MTSFFPLPFSSKDLPISRSSSSPRSSNEQQLCGRVRTTALERRHTAPNCTSAFSRVPDPLAELQQEAANIPHDTKARGAAERQDNQHGVYGGCVIHTPLLHHSPTRLVNRSNPQTSQSCKRPLHTRGSGRQVQLSRGRRLATSIGPRFARQYRAPDR